MYYVLLLTYACIVKPGVDLHTAVAYGDVECLRELLCSSELVLDVNRHGPDGRTPLHLATLRGQVDCMRLLIEEGANPQSRTRNRIQNTPMHLAAMNRSPQAVRYLKQTVGSDTSLLNATNADGDTALHVAARRQNLEVLQELLKVPSANFQLKNSRGEKPVDLVTVARRFSFDRHSPEFLIQDLLRSAEDGVLPTDNEGLELSDFSGCSSSSCSRPLDVGEGAPSSGAGMLPRVEEHGEVDKSRQLEAHAAQHSVPLLAVPKDSEQELLRRASFEAPAANASLAITNCGISSFMLSAGLGALSQAFLSTIQEDEEEKGSTSGKPVAKASFQDFVDVKKLGEGAFGKVNLVRHKGTGELFAMKLMDKAKFKAQKITSKAHSEQYLLKTTRHPFVVSLHYAFQGSTFWVLVMEYCPNGDLQHELCAHGTPGLLPAETARLCGEVLLAIEHLHRIQVIFRDLKAENVVLDAERRCKVTDFGLAKKVPNAEARTVCGSYGYVAPEIMTGKAAYTYAVDLYSFGVMLYLLLSGGELSPKKQQRLPPMRHVELQRKIRAAERGESSAWVRAPGALPLLNILTSEDPLQRTTAAGVKKHLFFTQHLGRGVDALLTDKGPFPVPSKASVLASRKSLVN